MVAARAGMVVQLMMVHVKGAVVVIVVMMYDCVMVMRVLGVAGRWW